MKKNLFLLVSLATAFFSNAQNVGIGTTTPLARLHVFNGTSGATPLALSPLVVENNGHTYINILSPAANENGVMFGQPGSSANGAIVYNNISTLNGFHFRTNGNITRMAITSAGNVGIATINPSEKLEVAGNIKAVNYSYTTPKTLFYNLSGIEFVPEFSLDTTVIGVGSGAISMQSSIAGRRLIAPVHLPHGATLVNMTVYISDYSGVNNLQVILYRKTITSNFFPDNMGFIASSGSPSVVMPYQTPLFSSLVDNSVYTYYISAGPENFNGSWTGNMYLQSIVIEYTLSATQ
ncbi:MAG: hypothetical protein ABIR18_06640 [Chitinophagaceae bacterium]